MARDQNWILKFKLTYFIPGKSASWEENTQLVNSDLSCTEPEKGGQGVRTPLKNHKNIGFLSNTGPDPLKNHKATKPVFNVGPPSAHQRNTIEMAFRWQANDGPLIVVFGSSLPSSTKNKQKTNV